MAYDTAYFNWYRAGWDTSRQAQYEHLSPFLEGLLNYLKQNFGGKSAGGHSQRGSSGNNSVPSAHAFGAALDWSYGRDRQAADRVIAMITSDPGRWGIQRIHDYDRLRVWTAGEGWKPQKRGSHGGGMNPGNTWLHLEVNQRTFNQRFNPGGGSGIMPYLQNQAGMASSDPHNWAGIARALGNQGDPRFAQYRTSGGGGGGISGYTGGTMNPTQIAQVAYQAGFRGEALTMMVAIAMGESGGNPRAHGVDGDDNSYGLWQINMIGGMGPARRRQYGLGSNDDLWDPMTNARVAFDMSGGGSDFTPWSVYTRGLYKKHYAAAQAGVEQAAAAGILDQPLSGGASGMTMMDTFGMAAPQPAVTLPSDTRLVRVPWGLFAMYDLGGGNTIHWEIPWWDGSVAWDESRVETLTEEQAYQQFPNSVRGGYANELGPVGSSFGTFAAFWDSIVGQVLGYTNPAKDDPDVRRVLAEFAARPDMSEAELRNRLQATPWFQNRTQAQLEWNGLSQAEQGARVSEVAAQMEQSWFQFVGSDLLPDTPGYRDWYHKIASGEVTFGWWIENVAKQTALGNGESPWSRTIRTEQETQRQRPIDIENTSNNIREQLNRWGLQWGEGVTRDWATGLVEKRYSDEDLMKEIKNQAKVLFPLKDPEMETLTYAQPWIQTHDRVLERTGSLFTPEIQGAMQRGLTAWDFEKELRKSAAWAGTKNGQAAMYDTIGQVGRMFGYA